MGQHRDRTAEVVERVRERAEPRLERVATTVGTTAAPLVARAVDTASPYVDRAVVTARPVLLDLAGTAGEVLDTSRVRGSAAWDALRGDRVGPPVAVRRWPWAVGAAVLGAAAGAAAALVVGRLVGTDAPDAQEPEDLEAVVDRPGDGPTAVPPAGPPAA